MKKIAKFKEFLSHATKKLQSIEDKKEFFQHMRRDIQEILSNELVHILCFHPKEKSYEIPYLGKEFSFSNCKESIIHEAIKKKIPLLLKDLQKSTVYSQACDDLLDDAIEELLVVPLFIRKDLNSDPDLLIWSATSIKDSSSLQEKSILYLMKYLEKIAPLLLALRREKQLSCHDELQFCRKENEKIKKRAEQDRLYFHSLIHDIRSPMSALSGFLELLLEEEVDSHKKEYLNLAKQGSKHIIDLISDALDVAKISSGNFKIDKREFSPFLEFSDTINLYYDSAKRKEITLLAFIGPNLPEEIISDPYRIKQILSNLLSNALKFTPKEGEIFIEILHKEEEERILFSVQDNGIGIEEKKQKDIFEPYKQENKNTQSQYGGTGLGLSISSQLAILLGGKLDLESKKGEGSKFFFSIPVEISKEGKRFNDLEEREGKKILLYKKGGLNEGVERVLSRYLHSFHQELSLAGPSESIDSILEKEDSFYDLLILEAKYFDEKEGKSLQRLLDQGKTEVCFIEDFFENFSSQFEGKIKKLPLPLLPIEIKNLLQKAPEKREDLFSNSTSKKSFVGKKALVVDDDPINIRLMKEILHRLGLKSQETLSAKHALEQLTQNSFDLLIIDENMPEMLGSDAIKSIKKKGLKISPIISLSGDDEHKNRIKKAGADEILMKPIQIQELKNILVKYFP